MATLFGSMLGAAAGGILNYGSTIAKQFGGTKGIMQSAMNKIGSYLTPKISQKFGLDKDAVDSYFQKGSNYIASKGADAIGKTKFV